MKTIAIVLAGGKGTRSANPNIPKLGQLIGEKTQFEHICDLLSQNKIKDALIISGHLGDQVSELVQSFPTSINLEVTREPEPKGTLPALKFASTLTDADRFLILLGDILCSFDINLFLDQWEKSGKSVAVISHPSSHPLDSDVAFPLQNGRVIVRSKSENKQGIPNMSSAGVFALTRKALQLYSDSTDIGSDVLPLSAENDDLFCWIDSHYFKDTGTPDRLEQANKEFNEGIFSRRGSLGLRSAIFLDRDGVINPTFPEIYNPSQVELIPGVAKEISSINQIGIPVFVVTNQPGIAKGFMTENDHLSIRAEFDRQLHIEHAFVDEYVYCPHHPDSGFDGEVVELKISCECRKPSTGLVLDISRRHGISTTTSVMIGDTWRDFEMAQTAGMTFHHVSNQCEITEPHFCFSESNEAIAAARLKVTK